MLLSRLPLFLRRVLEKEIMINHENGHSRPSYLAIKDKDILWFIPLSSKVDKYRKIIQNKKRNDGRRTKSNKLKPNSIIVIWFLYL